MCLFLKDVCFRNVTCSCGIDYCAVVTQNGSFLFSGVVVFVSAVAHFTMHSLLFSFLFSVYEELMCCASCINE